jgi:hypothetical protein
VILPLLALALLAATPASAGQVTQCWGPTCYPRCYGATCERHDDTHRERAREIERQQRDEE